MTIEVNLKNGKNYIFKNVESYSYSDLAWDPEWFWVDSENGSRRYIAASAIQDILIMDDSVLNLKKEEDK